MMFSSLRPTVVKKVKPLRSSCYRFRSFSTSSSSSDSDDLVLLTPYPDLKVSLLTLNRPKALNALNDSLITRLLQRLKELDDDPSTRVIVLTGSEKAFAAGADIKEMNSLSYSEVQKRDMLGFWNEVKTVKKPLIAAVSGFALGGGCELAMACDFIVARGSGISTKTSDSDGKPNLAPGAAQFGQPEVLLGTIPGCGGTQRLTHAVGKAKAMRWILNGGLKITAEEAFDSGLVARVVENGEESNYNSQEKFIEEVVVNEAGKIAKYSSPVLNVAKECINESMNMGLDSGLLYERRNFHATWGFEDRKEGMTAFAEKRKAKFMDC